MNDKQKNLNGNLIKNGNQRIYDEILEAIWICREKDTSHISEIKKECHIYITEDLLLKLQDAKVLIYNDEMLLLTADGEELAKNVIRRHRLAECLIEHTLNLKDEQLESIACSFEHVLIPEVEESICILLGHPTTCPHGHPLPEGNCCKLNDNQIKTIVSMKELIAGDSGKIAYIRSKDHSRLHQLCSMGLNPGTLIELHQKKPSYIIRSENNEVAFDEEIAEDIYLWPQDH